MKKGIVFAILLLVLLTATTVSANRALPLDLEVINELVVSSPVMVNDVGIGCLVLERESINTEDMILDNRSDGISSTYLLYCVDFNKRWRELSATVSAADNWFVNIGF